MGLINWGGSIEEILDDIKKAAVIYAEEVEKIVGEEMKDAENKTYSEFGTYQERVITKIFNDAVNQFYADYNPQYYHRTKGLFDVLDIKFDSRGVVLIGEYGDLLYNPDRLHTDRNGGSLFDKVFKEGWHGGAETISSDKVAIWGTHPDDGIPYYRTPVPYYTHWGERAIQTESPYSIVFRTIEDAATTETLQDQLQRLLDKNTKDAVNKSMRRIKELQKKIFS